MDLIEKSLLVGICNWITKQPEYRKKEITDPESLFYHVSVEAYSKLIMRFVRDEVENSKHGNCTIFDVIGHSGQESKDEELSCPECGFPLIEKMSGGVICSSSKCDYWECY